MKKITESECNTFVFTLFVYNASFAILESEGRLQTDTLTVWVVLSLFKAFFFSSCSSFSHLQTSYNVLPAKVNIYWKTTVFYTKIVPVLAIAPNAILESKWKLQTLIVWVLISLFQSGFFYNLLRFPPYKHHAIVNWLNLTFIEKIASFHTYIVAVLAIAPYVILESK